MTLQRLRRRKSLRLRPLLPMILSALLLTMCPSAIFAQGPRPLALPRQQSQPCADSDNSERCRLLRAVSAAIDEIENLKKQLRAASEAIAAQEKAIEAANQAIAAGAKEREAYEKTIQVADDAIAKQQGLLITYERTIATLQTMVDMVMKRVEVLEKERDRANARTAKLGALLTVAGIVVAVIKR